MATPFPFVSGAVLTAAQMNAITELPISAKTASYVLTAGDAGDRIQMTSASATTITVNTGLFSAGQSVFIYNLGAGTCTITAGTATVTTTGSLALAQNGGGTLLFTSSSAATFFPSGGIGYGTATGGTGVVAGPTGYNYTSFIASGTLTVTKAGLFDVLVFGGGSGGHGDNNYGGGGGSGGISQQTIYLSANATVTIGAGGAADSAGNPSSIGAIPNGIAAAGGIYVATSSNRTQQLGASQGSTAGNTLPISNIQGYTGGSSSTSAGGGGGSTTAVGGNASPNVGGNGGAGFDVSAFIGGSALFKGAGGGGGAATTGGTGGSSIGGNGAGGATNGTTPAANTASGGGGRGLAGATTAGSSGIIYIRFKV
jgi:hypothetical protein